MEAKVLSDQEKRLKRTHGHLNAEGSSARIRKIYESFRDGPSRVDIQRARFFTESFKETEGQPLELRWAKALYHIAENIEVYIEDGQLLAGRAGGPGKYGLLYPELDGSFLEQFVNQVQTRRESPFEIAPEDIRIISEEIAPYWKGKTYYEEFSSSLPEDVLKLTYDPEDHFSSRYIVNETSSMRSALQWVHDYQYGIEHGYEAIKADAREALKTAKNKAFYEAEIIVSDAIILFAHRYSEEASRLAGREKDPVRRAELEELSRICEKVPRYPAETFHEAVQSQWFLQVFSRLEQKTGATISNGRMDQYFYPYYKKDLEAGRITPEKAKELFRCMWLAMAQYQDLYVSPAGVKFNEGYAHWEAVTVGGTDTEGNDATNDLTYILLQDKREFPLNYPDLAARVHENSPDAYLREVAATIKEGSGFPKLLNDAEVVPVLVGQGADIKSARDYAVSGCTEVRMPNLDTFTTACPFMNLAAIVELALYNGRMRQYGDELLTLETGDVHDFATYEEFEQAVIRQEQYLLKIAFAQQSIANQIHPKHFAAPFGSSLHALCRKSGTDLHAQHVPGGVEIGFFDFIGYGTVADSLAAVKKTIYDEKTLNWDQLLEALDDNFEGHELVRQRLLRAPSYGNDDPYADEIAKKIDRVGAEYAELHSKELGMHLDIRYVSQSANVPFGHVIGATPNGRYAGDALSDGSSASQGADVNGPTSVLLSNFRTKNPEFHNRASRLLNIKFSPSVVEGEKGIQLLVAFIRAWSRLHLWHLQFNIINRETLLEAQKHPEDYRSLLVRVAGYSAYFVQLTKELQDDIIHRTEHESLGA